MSYTTMTFFSKENGKPSHDDEVHNSWRGAMAVWNYMEEKYLPEFIPEWVKDNPSMHEEGRKYHRLPGGTSEQQKEVWEVVNLDTITRQDQIVMMSTFDHVLVKRENIPELLKAFRSTDFPNSLEEQADYIEEAFKDEDIFAVGWNQTSVCCNGWRDVYELGLKPEDEEDIEYNINTMDKHWFLFEEDLKDK